MSRFSLLVGGMWGEDDFGCLILLFFGVDPILWANLLSYGLSRRVSWRARRRHEGGLAGLLLVEREETPLIRGLVKSWVRVDWRSLFS